MAQELIPVSRAFADPDWTAMLNSLDISKQKHQVDLTCIATAADLEEHPVRELSLTKHVTYQDPYAPKDPLIFAERHWQYRPVDPTALLGAWARDNALSTPHPMPMSIAFQWSIIVRKVQESIDVLELRLSPDGKQVLVVAHTKFMPKAISSVAEWVEPFNLDGTETHWAKRRDLKLGRCTGQVFQTTDGIMITRIKNSGLISKEVDMISEDYSWAGPGGLSITRSMGWEKKSNRKAHQYLVGRLPK